MWRTRLRTSVLISVHGHTLRVPAQLAVGGWRDRSAARHATGGAALLEGEQLLGAEGLVVDLAGRLNEIL